MEKYTPKQEGPLLSGGSQYEALEAEFLKEFLTVTRRMEREIRHHPRKLFRMLDDYGPVEAASRLARNPSPSSTFVMRLLRRNRLDLAMESFVIKPEWSPLFPVEVVKAARDRLEQYHVVSNQR